MSDRPDGYEPIETAPKDGRLVRLCWMYNGEPQDEFVMMWDDTMRNGLFPGAVGMWTLSDKSMTWMESPDGGPTHWRHFVQ